MCFAELQNAVDKITLEIFEKDKRIYTSFIHLKL